MTVFLFTLASAVANVLGAAAVVSRRKWSSASLELLLGVAAGFMIAVALIDMLPAAYAGGTGWDAWVAQLRRVFVSADVACQALARLLADRAATVASPRWFERLAP